MVLFVSGMILGGVLTFVMITMALIDSIKN